MFVRSSHLEMLLQTGVMQQSNFIEITLRHGSSPVYLLHIFRTPFSKNTSGPLLLNRDFLQVNSIRPVAEGTY